MDNDTYIATANALVHEYLEECKLAKARLEEKLLQLRLDEREQRHAAKRDEIERRT